VYTQKQLIESKKCAGIIQACLPILLTTPVTLHRVSTFFTGAVISSLSRELSWERKKVKKWRDERIN
jgi:hypothetical protein